MAPSRVAVDEGPQRALVTIQFLISGEEEDPELDDNDPRLGRSWATRYWYHIPRVGDLMDLVGPVFGRRVIEVVWTDDEVICHLSGQVPDA